MLFWSLVTAITVIACAALYYAALGRRVNEGTQADTDALTDHHRRQLEEIESDIRIGRLNEEEGVAAKAELAREIIRLKKEGGATRHARNDARLVPLAILGVGVLAVAAYTVLGRPELPGQPLASRPEAAAQNIDLDDAVSRIEQRLAEAPDDLRGWQVIAPVYMQLGRFDDAVNAYRRINALAPSTPDSETDLAEAIMLSDNGAANDEARALLRKAAEADPAHTRSRFYLASDATRQGRFDEAAEQWRELLALAKPEDAWKAAAEAGLAAAEAGRSGAAPASADDAQQAIGQMVAGLAERLDTQGGTLEEWTRLVRSYTVLGNLAEAQAAYDRARQAYPSATDRAELDSLAASAGLKLGEQAQ